MATTTDPTTDPTGAVPTGAVAVDAERAGSDGSWPYDVWRRAWLPLSRSPRWFPLLPWLERRELRACRRGDELVIEGYPRSGNTFAVQAFLSVNAGVRVSHHMHAPANVLRALELGVPAVVLVRTPRDAVASEVIREPRKRTERALREWVSFYETVRPFADRLVIAGFDEVVHDLGAVVARVNARWATSFVPYAHSPEADRAVLAGIDARARARGKRGIQLETQVPRPSASRDVAKAGLAGRLATPSALRLLARAEELHADLLGHAARAPHPA